MYVVLSVVLAFSLTLCLPCWVFQGKEPTSSCFPADSKCRAVDYIWYSTGTLKVSGVLKAPAAKHIEGGIPNDVFPSDHLSLKAILAFQ